MRYSQDSHSARSGFTLVEILVIVPMVMITVGIIIGFLTTLTGDALKSRARSEATYNIQAALDQIEQDVRLSVGALTRTSGITSPQGVNNNFHGSGDFNDTSRYLILRQNATTQNPYNSSRQQVFYSDQPNSCANNKEQNTPLQVIIVYFVDDGTLKKRTIMPAYNTDSSNQVCDLPWQQRSCKVTSSTCPVQDSELLKNVAGFDINYFETPTATSPVTGSSIPSANSIRVELSTSLTVAGEPIDVTNFMRATRINQTASMLFPQGRLYV